MVDISVIVPVRGDPRIRDCLAALGRQHCTGSFEILVVENDRNRPLQSLIESFPVRYLCCPEVGSYRARNAGIAAASGRIIAFTDSGCRPSADWLERLNAYFSNEFIGGVGGCISRQPAQNRLLDCQRGFMLENGLQHLIPISQLPYAPTGNVAYRRDLLLGLGGFDEAFFSGGDVDLAWRLQLRGWQLIYGEQAVVSYRSRATFLSYYKQFYKYGLGHVQLFKKHRGERRWLFNSYPFRGLLKTASLACTVGLFDLLKSGKTDCLAKCSWDLIEYAALLTSALVGSLRFRVLYV